MSRNTNKHDLSRYIPSEIKREIRQACGFGCIFCGNPICHYDHIDPEFEDAKEHNPSNMALICAYHHDYYSRAKQEACGNHEKIKEIKKEKLSALKYPAALRQGIASGFYNLKWPLNIRIGSNQFSNFNSIISIDDNEDWFRIEQPESENHPPRIFAKFFDEEGNLELEIENNEFIVYSSSWDVIYSPSRLIISRGLRKPIALRLLFEDHQTICIDRIDMRIYCSILSLKENGNLTMKIGNNTVNLTGSSLQSADCIIKLPSYFNSFQPPPPSGTKLYEYRCNACKRPGAIRMKTQNRTTHMKCIACGANVEIGLAASMIKKTTNQTFNKEGPQIQSKTNDIENHTPTSVSVMGANNYISDMVVANQATGIRISQGASVSINNYITHNVNKPIDFDQQ